jgi:hypothetical protein
MTELQQAQQNLAERRQELKEQAKVLKKYNESLAKYRELIRPWLFGASPATDLANRVITSKNSGGSAPLTQTEVLSANATEPLAC